MSTFDEPELPESPWLPHKTQNFINEVSFSNDVVSQKCFINEKLENSPSSPSMREGSYCDRRAIGHSSNRSIIPAVLARLQRGFLVRSYHPSFSLGRSLIHLDHTGMYLCVTELNDIEEKKEVGFRNSLTIPMHQICRLEFGRSGSNSKASQTLPSFSITAESSGSVVCYDFEAMTSSERELLVSSLMMVLEELYNHTSSSNADSDIVEMRDEAEQLAAKGANKSSHRAHDVDQDSLSRAIYDAIDLEEHGTRDLPILCSPSLEGTKGTFENEVCVLNNPSFEKNEQTLNNNENSFYDFHATAIRTASDHEEVRDDADWRREPQRGHAAIRDGHGQNGHGEYHDGVTLGQTINVIGMNFGENEPNVGSQTIPQILRSTEIHSYMSSIAEESFSLQSGENSDQPIDLVETTVSAKQPAWKKNFGSTTVDQLQPVLLPFTNQYSPAEKSHIQSIETPNLDVVQKMVIPPRLWLQKDYAQAESVNEFERTNISSQFSLEHESCSSHNGRGKVLSHKQPSVISNDKSLQGNNLHSCKVGSIPSSTQSAQQLQASLLSRQTAQERSPQTGNELAQLYEQRNNELSHQSQYAYPLDGCSQTSDEIPHRTDSAMSDLVAKDSEIEQVHWDGSKSFAGSNSFSENSTVAHSNIRLKRSTSTNFSRKKEFEGPSGNSPAEPIIIDEGFDEVDNQGRYFSEIDREPIEEDNASLDDNQSSTTHDTGFTNQAESRFMKFINSKAKLDIGSRSPQQNYVVGWCSDDALAQTCSDMAQTCSGMFALEQGKHMLTKSSCNEPNWINSNSLSHLSCTTVGQPSCNDPQMTAEQMAMVEEYIKNALGAPSAMYSYFSEDATTGHPVVAKDQHSNGSSNHRTRNRVAQRNAQAGRLRELRKEMTFASALKESQAQMRTIKTTQSFNDVKPVQAFTNRAAKQFLGSDLLSSVVQSMGHTHDVEPDVIEDEDVAYYDSDPEDTRERTIYRGPRRVSADINNVREDKTPKEGLTGLGKIRNKLSRRVDEDLVKNIVQIMKNDRLTLMWHPTQNPNEPNKPPTLVRLWIESGLQLVDGSFLLPKMTWTKASEEGGLKTGKLHKLDLLDICRIRANDRVDREKHPFASKTVSFIIETQADVFLFEAETAEERDRVVYGMKVVVARLASLLMMRDYRAAEEFFGDQASMVPGQAPF